MLTKLPNDNNVDLTEVIGVYIDLSVKVHLLCKGGGSILAADFSNEPINDAIKKAKETRNILAEQINKAQKLKISL